MKAEDLVEILEERPFVPLRLCLSNGRSHEIRHPEMVIVSPDVVVIGMRGDNGSKLAERVRWCSTAHIVEVEPVVTSS